RDSEAVAMKPAGRWTAGVCATRDRRTCRRGPPLWSGRRYGVTRGEEAPQRRIDLTLVGDRDGDELLVLTLAEGRHQRALRAIVPLTDLAVAKEVALLHQSVDEVDTALVVPRQVVAVGEVERVDIPVVGIEALFDELQRQLVGRGDLRAAALAMREELL